MQLSHHQIQLYDEPFCNFLIHERGASHIMNARPRLPLALVIISALRLGCTIQLHNALSRTKELFLQLVGKLIIFKAGLEPIAAFGSLIASLTDSWEM